MTSSATRTLAHWAAGVELETMPEEVQHACRRLVVDYLGAAIVGSTTEVSAILRATTPELNPGMQATIVQGGRASAAGAAFANGTAAHGLELDDGYTPGSVHPSAATLPAILALAEWKGIEASRVLPAIAVAVEVTTRIAAAAHPATLHAGFHNTPLAGVLGAAAGCALMLGGGANQLASALGLAGSHAGGLREYHAEGSEVKRIHAGKAARDGLSCAVLACAGVGGPHTVLEGSQGYFHAFAHGKWNSKVLLDGLGTEWTTLQTYVKPYPCCRHLHGPIDAALAIHAGGTEGRGRIDSIEVATYSLASGFDRSQPTNFLESQLSIPYTVAVALTLGRVDLDTFADDVRNDAEILRLADVVTVHTDAEATDRYPRQRPARVTVHFEDGSEVTHSIDQPRGEPENPISDQMLNLKFLSLVTPVLGEVKAQDTLSAAWAMTDIPAITTALGSDLTLPPVRQPTGYPAVGESRGF